LKDLNNSFDTIPRIIRDPRLEKNQKIKKTWYNGTNLDMTPITHSKGICQMGVSRKKSFER